MPGPPQAAPAEPSNQPPLCSPARPPQWLPSPRGGSCALCPPGCVATGTTEEWLELVGQRGILRASPGPRKRVCGPTGDHGPQPSEPLVHLGLRPSGSCHPHGQTCRPCRRRSLAQGPAQHHGEVCGPPAWAPPSETPAPESAHGSAPAPNVALHLSLGQPAHPSSRAWLGGNGTRDTGFLAWMMDQVRPRADKGSCVSRRIKATREAPLRGRPTGHPLSWLATVCGPAKLEDQPRGPGGGCGRLPSAELPHSDPSLEPGLPGSSKRPSRDSGGL